MTSRFRLNARMMKIDVGCGRKHSDSLRTSKQMVNRCNIQYNSIAHFQTVMKLVLLLRVFVLLIMHNEG